MKNNALAFFTLVVVAGSAFAQSKTDTGLNYNQIGLGYGSVTATVSGKDYTFNGYGVGGSALLGDSILIDASSLSANGDVNGTNVNVTQTAFGIGARAKIASNADVYGKVSYLDAKGATATATVSDNGYGVTVGVKALMTQGVTGSLFAGQSKLSKSDATNAFGFGLDFNVSPSAIVGASYVSDKESRQYMIKVSYAF